MWDENKDNENAASEHAEWSGTPFQGRESEGTQAADEPTVEVTAEPTVCCSPKL